MAIPRPKRLKSIEAISSQGIIIPDALAAEQLLDPVRMLNAFLEQRATLTRQPSYGGNWVTGVRKAA
jgi:hypothetical protein